MSSLTMTRLPWFAAALGCAASLAGAPLAAQTVARISLAGGQATDSRGITSGAFIVAPSLTIAPSSRASLTLGASGTRFVTGGWSLAGSGAISARVPIGPILGVALDGGGTVLGTSYHAASAEVNAVPSLTAKLGLVTLFAGAHAGAARVTTSALPAGPFGAPVASTAQRTSAGPVFGAQLALAPSRAAGLAIGYREQHDRVAGSAVSDRVGSISVLAGGLTLEGAVGARQAADERATIASIRAELAISPLLAVEGGAERYPSDRLTGVSGGRALHGGLVLRFGASRRPAEARGVGSVPRGATRLAISAPDASTVELAGDWNGWHPAPATRAPNGVWYADVALPPGTYRYAFRVDGHWRAPDRSASDDGPIGPGAVLVVASQSK
jgi:hypothetical protein